MSTCDFIERRKIPLNASDDTIQQQLADAVNDMHARGAQHMRASRKAITGEIIVEGWRTKPPMVNGALDEGDLPI